MGFTRWLLRPGDKQVLLEGRYLPGPLPAMVSLYLEEGAVFGVMSSTALAIEVQPYWNVFQPLQPPTKAVE